MTTRDPLGHVTTNLYDGFANVSRTTDPFGNTTHYTYDGRGGTDRLTETDVFGFVSSYLYDDAHHVTHMTDRLGNVTDSTYDANGNKLTQGQTRTDYGGSGAYAVTKYTYDASNRLTKTVAADGATTSTTFTATGKRATSTDALNRVTTYTYDALDRLVTTTMPDGTTQTQTYDAEGRRLSSTDAAGNTTRYQYDGVGRVVRTTFADGSSTSTTYDAAGQAIQNVDELGHVRWSAYDANGRLTSTTDAGGAVTQYRYDHAGNRMSMVDALGRTTSFAYDAMNRAVGTTYPDGSTDSMRYDALGRVMAKTDPNAHSTEYGYDAMGRLIRVTDQIGNVTLYTYNEHGERLSQVDASPHTTAFKIDLFTGRQFGRVFHDGAQDSIAYDRAGQMIQHTDFRGRTTSYAYDRMGRLLSRTYPDASVVSFTYAPDGRRATATDARGTTTYAYDNRRRIVQATYPDGRVLSYGYDAHGDQTSLSAKIGATVLTTTTAYDANERVSTVTDPLGRVFTMGYDADGNRTSAAYPNGTSTGYTYDALSRLTSMTTVAGSTAVQSFAYLLDPAGRRTRETDGDGTVRAYGYDGIDRLVSETVTGSLAYTKAFAYDRVGNRLTQTTTGAGAGSVTYAYDVRDRLTTENATSYGYDANGNVTSKSGEANYGWDFDDRLTSATMTSGTLVEHQYDADGNRVKTSVTPPSTGPVACSGNSAMLLREDTSAQGTWKGEYGAEGQYISGETPAPPAYGSVTVSNAAQLTISDGTGDIRALQQPSPQTSRIASMWYTATSETFHVATTDGNAHTVAFYMLDWYRGGIAQTVTVKSTTGDVLVPARTFSNFQTGMWLVYTVCGNADFVFTATGGNQAQVAGVFFAPAPGAATTTNLLVDTSGGLSQVVVETDGSGALSAYYVRAGDELLEVMRPGPTQGTWSTRFVHHDGLGSVRTLTDESGTTVDTRAYEAFGTKNVEAGSDPLAYGFAGEPFEATSQLAYHRARWMDSRVGRFAGMDPIDGIDRQPVTWHRYVSTSDDPVDRIDPSGRMDMASLGAAIIGFGILSLSANYSLPAGSTIGIRQASGVSTLTLWSRKPSNYSGTGHAWLAYQKDTESWSGGLHPTTGTSGVISPDSPTDDRSADGDFHTWTLNQYSDNSFRAWRQNQEAASASDSLVWFPFWETCIGFAIDGLNAARISWPWAGTPVIMFAQIRQYNQSNGNPSNVWNQ